MSSKSLGDLLAEAAVDSAPEPDVDVLWSVGRRRRTRRRVGGWLIGVGVLAAATVVVLDGTRDEEVKTVAPVDTAVHVVNLAKSRLSFVLHDSWTLAPSSLTPNLGDPREVFSAATYATGATGANCAQFPTAALDEMGARDAFVSLQERGTLDGNFPARPGHFPGKSVKNPPGHELPECLTRPRQGRFDFWWIPFSDQGRGFYAIVAIGVSASSETRDQTWAVLDSLRIEPPLQSTSSAP